MKYMGSKRSMLKNGLGKLLIQQSQKADRFVDLFTGAGYVSWYVAENTNKPVLAVDLQSYSTTLARAIIGRDKALDNKSLEDDWLQPALEARNKSPLWEKASEIAGLSADTNDWVNRSRLLCATTGNSFIIWNAYGGHYFSPSQAITFDFLLSFLPETEPYKTVCLSACISAATECVASPGHTAQPFQPTESASRFIATAWKRDPIEYCKKVLKVICPRHAQVIGDTTVNSALSVAKNLSERDFVFIDPPYSSVQYSRFYHVLEVISRGQRPSLISGVGRYPPIIERPQSQFSNISQSKLALQELLGTLGERGCIIVLTFPSGNASNGLSGDFIKSTASESFNVEDYSTIEGKFSTLGGNNTKRDARKESSELILLMTPK